MSPTLDALGSGASPTVQSIAFDLAHIDGQQEGRLVYEKLRALHTHFSTQDEMTTTNEPKPSFFYETMRELDLNPPTVSDGNAFYERSTNWERTRRLRAERARKELEEAEVADCKFQPDLSQSRSATRTRSPVRSRSTSRGRPRPEDRLTAAGKRREYRKATLEEESRAKELQGCTFQPDFSKTRRYNDTARRPHSIMKARPRTATQPSPGPAFTFHPDTSASRAGSVGREVTAYLEEPAHERLAKTTVIKRADRTPQRDAPVDVGQVVAKALACRDAHGKETPKSTPQSLAAFLNRQERCIRTRDSDRARVVRQRAKDEPFRPKINQKSRTMAVRRLPLHEKPHTHTVEKSYSFQPEINRQSHQIRARSPSAMVADASRYESRRQQLVARKMEREVAECTFRPAIENLPDNVPVSSRLQLSSTTARDYIARLRNEEAKRARHAAEVRREAEEREVEGCTFRPAIRSVPDFIRRVSEKRKVLVI